MTDVYAIVRGLVTEYETQGEHYRSVHQDEAADRLQRKADIVRTYLDA